MVKVENKESYIEFNVYPFFCKVRPKYDKIFHANPIIYHLWQDRW